MVSYMGSFLDDEDRDAAAEARAMYELVRGAVSGLPDLIDDGQKRWWMNRGHHDDTNHRDWENEQDVFWTDDGQLRHPSRLMPNVVAKGSLYHLASNLLRFEDQRDPLFHHDPEMAEALIYDTSLEVTAATTLAPIRVGDDGTRVTYVPQPTIKQPTGTPWRLRLRTDVCKSTCRACFGTASEDADHIVRSEQPMKWEEIRRRFDEIERRLGIKPRRDDVEDLLFGYPRLPNGEDP